MRPGERLDGMIATIMRTLFSHEAYQVIAGGQLRLIEAGVEPLRAWEMSKSCLVEFMADQQAKVGDPRFSWDQAGGREIVEAYEIDHWEVAA